MEEKILSKKQNGMMALLLTIIGYALGILVTVLGGNNNSPVLLIVGIIWLCIGWFPILGLKILKPQEALVLTLFGKYVGTLKEEGFYFVNPFCSSVNPAARTKLSQSGVDSTGSSLPAASLNITNSGNDSSSK